MSTPFAIFILCLMAVLFLMACATLLAVSPFLLVAWVCGGCPTGDNGSYYTLRRRIR